MFTKEYYERDKRHIGNALHIFFSDGSPKLELRIDFPVGHRKRRAEGMPLLVQKFEASVAAHFPAKADRGHQGAVRAQGLRLHAGERIHGRARRELT